MEPLTPEECSTHVDINDAQTTSDELRNCRILHDVSGCNSIQREISECFEFINDFINDNKGDNDFVSYVIKDSTKLEDIKEQLKHILCDLKRTDCSIVFAGETSSGKSSIVNAIIGEKILPTGILATTTRVCRVKYSEELKIATWDENEKKYREDISFQNTKEMAKELKNIAQTNDPKITYVDIFMQLPFQQGYVAIVDTPGIGDIDQKEVAQKMMDYLPNALAFVFVINVAAAGGIQKDRFIPILEHVKDSLKGMVCFDHDDVIFLLNKWDTLLDDDEKDSFLMTTREHLIKIWKDVKSDRILKLSMNKGYGEHTCLLNCFKRRLEDTVEKNKEKRCNVHLRLLREFISECDKILSPKLELAKENAKTNQSKFEEALANVSDLQKIWQEESLKLNENVLCFVDAATNQLHEYILHPDFKEKLLKSVAKSWRLKVNFNVKAQIEAETKQWEERHIHNIYYDIFVKKLSMKLQNICGSLAENLLKGFKMPFDLGKKILKGVVFSALSIAGGIVAGVLLAEPPVAAGVATLGIAFTGLINWGYVSDFQTVCEKAVNVGINTLSKQEIKQKMIKKYDEALKQNVKKALETMKEEIEKLKNELNVRKTKNTDTSSTLAIFMSLDDFVFKCKQRLLKIESK